MAAINQMGRSELHAWLAGILVEMFELEREYVTLDANLYADLDIDSIDAVDLAVRLKQLTGKGLAPEVFKTIRTVGDVVDALAALDTERTPSTSAC